MKYTPQDVAIFLSEMDQFSLDEWAANRLLKANPWMIRGENMISPIGLFKNGKEIQDKFNPIDNDEIQKYVVSALSLPLSLKELAEDNLNDWKIAQWQVPNNMMYFYTVHGFGMNPACPNILYNIGDLVRVTNNLDYETYEVPLTEEMFTRQKIYIRYGVHELSKRDALAIY